MAYKGKMSRVNDYVLTRTDENLIYSVWHGGHAPLNGGGGTYIGRVTRKITGWYATTDDGQAYDDLPWVGGFRTRTEATVFLVGARYVRDGILGSKK
jgi:hypothetical protein